MTKGEPSGTLRESATDLVWKVAPKPTQEERNAGLRAALKKMNELGITGFQEASAGPESLQAYRDAEQRGVLTARVTIAQYADPEKPIEQVTDLKKMRETYKGNHIHPTAVKIFVDGVIEANTAALLLPYLDSKEPGELLWTPEKLNAFVQRIDSEGFQVHFHAIGDSGVRAALDSVEHARKVNKNRDARPVLAHIELIDPAGNPTICKTESNSLFSTALGLGGSIHQRSHHSKIGPRTFTVDLSNAVRPEHRSNNGFR